MPSYRGCGNRMPFGAGMRRIALAIALSVAGVMGNGATAAPHN